MTAKHRITTQFGFSSTAAEVIRGIRLDGKAVVVTGGAAGLGLETVRALAFAGASVTLAVRRPNAAEAVAEELRNITGNRAISVSSLDLSDLTSVHRFVERWDGPLHILINNAGIMALPTLQRTSEGREMQFATNFLGHFALTYGLREALFQANGARVVCLSSSANMLAPVIWDDIDFNFLAYDPRIAYAQSKTACALLAIATSEHWNKDGVFANAVNPGAIATGLQKYTGGLKTPRERQKTVAQGAATSVLVAASPLLDGVSGRYFEDCNEAEVVSSRPDNFGGGVAPYAISKPNALRIWDVALSMCGLRRDPV